MDYKKECVDIVTDARYKLIDIINKYIGNRENISIEIKRDLGDFVDYVTITKIMNGIVYYSPTDIYPNGFNEYLEDLSVNELYDIIINF
jgi:hypothetical protein